MRAADVEIGKFLKSALSDIQEVAIKHGFEIRLHDQDGVWYFYPTVPPEWTPEAPDSFEISHEQFFDYAGSLKYTSQLVLEAFRKVYPSFQNLFNDTSKVFSCFDEENDVAFRYDNS